LNKANIKKGGARPMIMNKFFITFSLTGKAGGVDSRSAPAPR
jgi:hypothetical protein